MQQLSLLTYQPTPEEMQPPAIASPFKLGDRVRCPVGEGSVYHLHPNSVWVAVGNVAQQWDLGEVEVVSETAPVSRGAIAFLQSQAAYYLLLIWRFRDGRKCSQAVRFNEMERLTAMRKALLEKIKTLEASK